MAFKRIKTIKGHDYWYLVENQRVNGKVVQRHIRYLGKDGSKLGTTAGSVSVPVSSGVSQQLGTTNNNDPQLSTTKPETQADKKTGEIITKIRKVRDSQKKTEIWQSLDLPRNELEKITRDMVLSLPPGYYKLHDRKYGTNIVDTMYEIYGWMPSMLVNESMMLGLQALYPEKVYASFTLGLDAIEIKARTGRSGKS